MAQAKDTNPKKGRKSSKPAADPVIAVAIGNRLKRIYDDVAGQPVPDRFKQLLDALSRAEKDP